MFDRDLKMSVNFRVKVVEIITTLTSHQLDLLYEEILDLKEWLKRKIVEYGLGHHLDYYVPQNTKELPNIGVSFIISLDK